jgi:chemosensory pili system protein ChpA (sensor histidine kinase/response regulator)
MGDGSVVVTLDMPALIASHYTSVIDDTDQGNLIQPHEETHTPTIMVVDDSVTVRKVTSRFLTREGFIVETARDGAEALRMVHDHAPDLMLVDVEMPRMDGFELLGTLRSSEKFENLPIVLITSRTGEKHKQRGLSLGANNYFGKPYREDQLLEEIKRLLKEVKNGR